MEKEHREQIIAAAWDTWGYLAHDAHQLCAECGDVLTEEEAIEFIVDADRTPVISKFLNDETYSYNEIIDVLKGQGFHL